MVLKRDELAAGRRDGGVPGDRRAAIIDMLNHSQPGIGCRESLQDFAPAVGRAIIHREQFEITNCLPEDALDRRRQQNPRIENRSDDADTRAVLGNPAHGRSGWWNLRPRPAGGGACR